MAILKGKEWHVEHYGGPFKRFRCCSFFQQEPPYSLIVQTSENSLWSLNYFNFISNKFE